MIIIFVITIALIGLTKSSQFRLEFNKNTSSILHSIAIVLVLLSHYSYVLKDFGKDVGGGFFGTIGCGIFLFTCGYGLIRSKLNNPSYLNGFLRKKVRLLGIPLILCSTAFQIILLIVKGRNGIYSIDQIIHGETILPTSWYAYVIILYYCAFYYLFRDANDVIDIRKSMNRFWAFSIVYIIGISLLHWGEYWCISILSFNVGIEYYFYAAKQKIVSKYKVSVLCIIIFSLILMWPNSVWQENLEPNTILSQIPSRLFLAFFPIILITIINSLKYKEVILFDAISQYTYYIYLVQGAIIISLNSIINNLIVYMITSLLFIAVCSYFLKIICNKMYT